MPEPGIRELLEAGVHFGHQTRRWNPKMRRFLHGESGGIYIIDLLQTEDLLHRAREFAHGIADRGGSVLFVGTKKQARDAIKETAESADMPYVNQRWLGGLLTNWQTISKRIQRLHDLERYQSEGQLELLPTKERMAAQADLLKLQANLGGVKNMQRVPDAVFVIDLKTEAIAIKEAQRLRIPIIGLVDTNCDPDGVAYVVPGNDDAIRSCAVITRAIGEVVEEGHRRYRAAEEKARAEAEAQARREAEERARREAEEQARREAEEAAARGDAQAEPGAQPVAPGAPATEGQARQARRAPRPTAEPAGEPVAPGVPATAEQVQAATGRTPAEPPEAAEAPAAETGDAEGEGGGGVLAAARDLAGGAAAAAGSVAEGAVEAAQDAAGGRVGDAVSDAVDGATEAARELADGARKAVEDVTGDGEDRG